MSEMIERVTMVMRRTEIVTMLRPSPFVIGFYAGFLTLAVLRWIEGVCR